MDRSLTLVIDPDERAEWYPTWLDGITFGLQHLGWRVMRSDRPYGLSVLTRYTLYHLLDRMPPHSAVLVEHDGYLPESLGGEPVDYDDPAVRVAVATTPSKAAALGHQVAAIGFPYLDRHLQPVAAPGERGRVVVFSQRVSEDNQALVAAPLAMEMVRRGWEVHWSTPWPVPDRYSVGAWLGVVPRTYDRPDLFALLRRARYVISTTVHGTTILACYEGWRSGAVPLVPLGAYADPYRTGYPRWEPGRLLSIIEEGPGVAWEDAVDGAWYDPVQVAARLVAAL